MHMRNNRRGEGYVDLVVCVLVLTMVMILVLNIFSFLTLKQDLDYFAKQMVETACAEGAFGEAVEERYEELAEETGLRPEWSFDGSDIFQAVGRTVQYGETVSVTLTIRSEVRGLGFFSIPVTLTARASGLSRRYWKS